MCGRITATFESSDIRVRWNLDRDLSHYTPRFNVAPETSPNIPVIVRQKGVNECRLMQWGLIPHWAADPSIGNRMINARAETLTELPSFKHIVDRRRCIIPADGFYHLLSSVNRERAWDTLASIDVLISLSGDVGESFRRKPLSGHHFTLSSKISQKLTN